jgi:hypothetical protein
VTVTIVLYAAVFTAVLPMSVRRWFASLCTCPTASSWRPREPTTARWRTRFAARCSLQTGARWRIHPRALLSLARSHRLPVGHACCKRRSQALNGTFVADALKSVGPLKRRVQQQEYSRTVMRKHFRCEKMAPIVDSFVAVVERTYPHWFVAELFDATLGQGTGK